jgi:hypothetical protein
MGRIQTGVDRLVALVKEKQKISIDDAAKTLVVSKTVVQEWADFLEEEGIIEIKYSFARTYLVDRKLTKVEDAQKEKEFAQQRETFIGKVDQTIQSVDHEMKGFEEFRREFESLKKGLAGSLEVLHTEIGALHALEHTKIKTTSSLTRERDAFKKQEADARRAISKEYVRYHEVLQALSKQEKTLAQHKKHVKAILTGETSAKTTLGQYISQAARLRSQVDKESRELRGGTAQLKKLESLAHATRKKLLLLQRQKLTPLIRERDRIALKARILEQKILAKAKFERAHAKKPHGTTVHARRSIEELFKRKKSIEHLLEAIERDKHALLDELNELEARAEAFRVNKNAARLEELRKKLTHIEAGKKQLQSHLAQFVKILR